MDLANPLLLSEEGYYEIHVYDILGNQTLFTFTIRNALEVDYYVADTQWEIEADALKYMSTDVTGDPIYTDTQYTGKEVRLVLKENITADIAFYVNGHSRLLTLYLEGDELMLSECDGTSPYSVFLSGDEAEPKSLFVDAYFGSNYSVDLKYQKTQRGIELIFPLVEDITVLWQLRLSDPDQLKSFVVQFELSDEHPDVQFAKVGESEALNFVGDNFYGVNAEVGVLSADQLDDDILIVAYRSEAYTTSFEGAQVIEMRRGTALATLSQSGFYKIVSTNKYGNETIVYLRINGEMTVSTKVSYDDGSERLFDFPAGTVRMIGSNGSATFLLSDSQITFEILKDGSTYTAQVQDVTGVRSFTLSEIGNYTLRFRDQCENSVELTVEIVEPTPIADVAYIVGGNTNALWHDRLYSNTPFGLDKVVMDQNRILYAAYSFAPADGSASVQKILYDMISLNGVDFNAENFNSSIGANGNGVYTVSLYDVYGNGIVKTVHISDELNLTLERLIQSETAYTPLILSQIIIEGAWSNYEVVLKNGAEFARLTVDGTEVSFTEGVYRMVFPQNQPEGSFEYGVSYIDEYGNTVSFTVHLYRKVPTVELSQDITPIIINNEAYVMSDFGYTWDDLKMTAIFTKDGGKNEIPYQNGVSISADGSYYFVFTDRAGNIATRLITRDTTVDYALTSGSDAIVSGVTVSEGGVKLTSSSEAITLVSVMRDGELIDNPTEGLYHFDEHGEYILVISDRLGNTEEIRFRVIEHAVGHFVYSPDENFRIVQLWYENNGYRLSYLNGVTVNVNGNHSYHFNMDGSYQVVIRDVRDGREYAFSLLIDSIPPAVLLVGAELGGITREDVTFDGMQEGDVLEIYRDGELYIVFEYGRDGKQVPVLDKSGNYKVLVSDPSGNTQEFHFEREFTTNASVNAIIILLLLSFGGALLATAFFRDKIKIK